MFAPTNRTKAIWLGFFAALMLVVGACGPTTSQSTPTAHSSAVDPIPDSAFENWTYDTEDVSEWQTEDGKRCWEREGIDKELQGSYIDHVNYPVMPDAPVMSFQEFAERMIAFNVACHGEESLHGEEYGSLQSLICENYMGGGLVLRDYLHGLRYHDGTEFSAVQCTDPDRIVVPNPPASTS